MKRAQLIKVLKRAGCVFVRRGGRHDIFRNPITGETQPVPRHREIDEHLARHIIKMLKPDN